MTDLPAVTCLCPTYGRFERLRDAVACFLTQDYPNKHLYILNDAPEGIRLNCNLGPALKLEGGYEGLPITVQNAPERFKTLGHKRGALLKSCLTPYVAHWDDDDLYLPYHLTQCVVRIVMLGVSCIKPRGAWWLLGRGDNILVKGPCHNSFEGQMVFDRQRALELGGYPHKDSGQALALMRKFRKAGEFRRFDPWPYISYCYRWGDGLHHISGSASGKKFARASRDFGGGEPLMPIAADRVGWAKARLRPLYERLVAGLKPYVVHPHVPMTEADFYKIKGALLK